MRSDGTLVANHTTETSVTDPVNTSAGNYSYTVIPFCDGRVGIEASTSSAMLGSGTSLPATFGFKSAEEFSLFTVIDVQNKYEAQYQWGAWIYALDDTYTADAGHAAVYVYHPEYDADDWLITPPFTVENGKKYRLTYTMWTKGDIETLAVTAGPQNTIESQSVITPATNYSHTDRRVFTQEFTATASGNYHVGFHITSVKKRFFLFVTDINIDEVPDENAPAAVYNLTVTPGEKGAMNATISFEAPDETVACDRLTEIESIEIYRGNDNTSIHTFVNPKPGEKLSWTDDSPMQGWNTYRVVAYTTEAAGEKQLASAYVGYDLPVAVTNLKAVETDGKVEITWDAPTQGQNGGYVNPDELTYTIYRLGDDEQMLTRSCTGAHYTDNGLDGSRMQRFVYYEVVPVSQTGIGAWALSEHLIFGDPYKGYFCESFADLATQNNPWTTYTVKGNKAGWELHSQGTNPICMPVDSDNGLATFASTSVATNTEGRLVSPKLDLSSMATPYFSFWLYHSESSEFGSIYGDEFDPYYDNLIPEVLLPDGTYEPLCDPIFIDDHTAGTGWVNYVFDLSKYKSQEYVRLSMHGVSKSGQDINVDFIEVFNQLQHDLGIYSLSGPSKLRAGNSATYSVVLYNDGVNASTGCAVHLLVNGQIASTKSDVNVAPEKVATIEFPMSFADVAEGAVLTVQARIEWDRDEYSANDLSNTVTTTITEALLPEVLDLNAGINGDKVTLSWDAPNAVRYNDSFEEYSPYDIYNIGDYSMIDRDGAYTYGFTDIYFPNTGARQAFMVLNPVALGIATFDNSLFGAAFDPRTGNQVLTCFGAYGNGNDDWFISPAVHGSRQVRFYAKSGDFAQGVDKYEVLYSTSTTNPESFTPISEVVTTGKVWELHEFTLPANARYFAIHCVSDDGFVLMVDDLEFIAKRTDCIYTHTGYNLYCNGKLVTNLPATATSYVTDAPADGVEQIYTLCATYEDDRESGAATAVINPSSGGLDEVGAETIRVSVEGNDIVVSAPTSIAVTITNISGQNIYAGETASLRHTVASGIYLVTVGTSTYKVIVR